MKPAIRVEHLCKQYYLGKRPVAGLRNLTEALSATARNFWQRMHGQSTDSPGEIFWALKDISFEIQRGEVVGIIGRNGAGKSTLLKILSRIVEPSAGRIEYRGRMASLLEVGTGFHAELTGRENIFMNAALMGMTRQEISRKLDEIIDFSGIEAFVDTPVKRYSSGMYVRLAFAVAAHLEPDILIVDEILAVGDATFQKKCMGRIEAVGKEGRTVLLVSHNLGAITALCNRCLFLDHGILKSDADTPRTVEAYLADLNQAIEQDSGLDSVKRTGTGKGRCYGLKLFPVDQTGACLPVAMPGEDLAVEVDVECYTAFEDADLAVIVYDHNHTRLIDVTLSEKGYHLTMSPGEKLKQRFILRDMLLRPGKYTVGLWLGRHYSENIDDIEQAGQFTVEHNPNNRHGLIALHGSYMCRFETTKPEPTRLQPEAAVHDDSLT